MATTHVGFGRKKKFDAGKAVTENAVEIMKNMIKNVQVSKSNLINVNDIDPSIDF